MSNEITIYVFSSFNPTHRHPQIAIRVVQTKPNAIRRRIWIQILLAAKHNLPVRCQSKPIAVWFLVVSVQTPSAVVALLQSFALARVPDIQFAPVCLWLLLVHLHLLSQTSLQFFLFFLQKSFKFKLLFFFVVFNFFHSILFHLLLLLLFESK